MVAKVPFKIQSVIGSSHARWGIMGKVGHQVRGDLTNLTEYRHLDSEMPISKCIVGLLTHLCLSFLPCLSLFILFNPCHELACWVELWLSFLSLDPIRSIFSKDSCQNPTKTCLSDLIEEIIIFAWKSNCFLSSKFGQMIAMLIQKISEEEKIEIGI